MNITFDDHVKKRLSVLTENEAADFVLDFNHTLSRKSISQDCCGITCYRIVAVNKGKIPAFFDASIPSNFGPIYYYSWAKMYLDQDMKIRMNGPLIEIMGSGELIAPNIEIVDYRKSDVTVNATQLQ